MKRVITITTTLMMMATSQGVAQEIADRIFIGGPVLTMEDAAPRAEALATKDGRILSVGSEADVMAHSGSPVSYTHLTLPTKIV